MRRYAWVFGVVACAGLLAGCVERRYVVTSDPPGAIVLRNGQPIGATPADDHFVYYGDYKFTLIKEGYETLQVTQHINTPWYEWFPLDFISENLNPWPIEDVRRFEYKLQPRSVPRADELLGEAQNLRNRGQSLEPPPGKGPAAAPPAALLPAAPPTAIPPAAPPTLPPAQ